MRQALFPVRVLGRLLKWSDGISNTTNYFRPVSKTGTSCALPPAPSSTLKQWALFQLKRQSTNETKFIKSERFDISAAVAVTLTYNKVLILRCTSLKIYVEVFASSLPIRHRLPCSQHTLLTDLATTPPCVSWFQGKTAFTVRVSLRWFTIFI